MQAFSPQAEAEMISGFFGEGSLIHLKIMSWTLTMAHAHPYIRIGTQWWTKQFQKGKLIKYQV